MNPRIQIAIASAAMLMGWATLIRAADEPTIALPATIEAFEASDQYAMDSGYVSEVKVDIGDHVTQGQVLAVIDDPELARRVEAARATLAARQEQAKAADATVEQFQKAALVARAQLAVYKSDLELAEVTVKRQEELFAAKAITDQQIDESRAKAHTAGSQASVGEAKVSMAQADIRAAEANRAVAQSQVVVSDAELARLTSLLQYTSIKAPFDGIVTRRMLNRGDLITAGRSTPLLTVQRIDTVRIFCDVPEASAAAVTAGTAATIKVYSLVGQSIDAKVTRISGALDPNTRTMRVEIDVPNPQEKLRAGMYAQVILTVRPAGVPEIGAKP